MAFVPRPPRSRPACAAAALDVIKQYMILMERPNPGGAPVSSLSPLIARAEPMAAGIGGFTDEANRTMKALVIRRTGPSGPYNVNRPLDRGWDVTILHGGQHEVEFN